MTSEKIRIWVTDFPRTTLEEDLWKLFQPFGEIDSVVIVHKFPKQPIAFIDMKNSLDAIRAINNLNAQIFQGKNTTVRKSTQQLHKERYVYALISFDRHECYIGETCDTKRRFKQHLNVKGKELSHHWILTLNEKPKPIILETVKPGYDTVFQAAVLETVWRFVAFRHSWNVINFPHLSELKNELEEAIQFRIKKWFEVIEKTSINSMCQIKKHDSSH